MTRRYGAGPAHLLVHLAAFALVAWTVLQIAGVGGRFSILLWFAGAVVVHDALLWPLYSALDRASGRVLPARMRNHVRIPVLLSGMLLLVFAPLILSKGTPVLARVSGLEPSGYALRWLLVTVALFAGSALLYAVRARRAPASTLER